MYTESPKQTEARTKNFIHHAPINNQAERYTRLRAAAGELALLYNTNCPESRELSLAHTKLEEAMFWANAAIARNQK